METNRYQGSKVFYGTPKCEVERIITAGKLPVLEIDVNGKRQVDNKAYQYGFALCSVFITAPPEMVYERLIASGEPMENIVSRLNASVEEIAAADEYNSIIVNYTIEATLKDMQDVVSGESNTGNRPDIKKYRKELMKLI